MSDALLKLQIGPVQEFIAAARSTRDLWSGSYMLSWLMAAGLAELHKHADARLIFPNPEGQPLIELHRNKPVGNPKGILTPNLPNLFVALVPTESAPSIAKEVESSIKNEWEAIARSVWDELDKNDLVQGDLKARFDRQIERFLSIAWQITPLENGHYAESYRRNGWELDAVRQTRPFVAWSPGGWESGTAMEKDSLTGKEEAICGGAEWLSDMQKRGGFWASLFKHEDRLGAITLVKRLWHSTYLGKAPWDLRTDSRDFRIPSTRGIAMHEPNSPGEDDDALETLAGEKYFAVLAFDGDQIGKWVGGELIADTVPLQQHHQEFSTALSKFALTMTRSIVEQYDGRLIYAGGDDVVALLPADTALACSSDLRRHFCDATKHIQGKSERKPDASVGIAMAHFKSPLQDVIRAAQIAEKTAKNKHGRSAVAVTLMKHSGEINEWGCQWDSSGLELYQLIDEGLLKKELSNKFPHRLAALLSPYLTQAGSNPEAGFAKSVSALIEQEFSHACERQSLVHGQKKNEQAMLLRNALDEYLQTMVETIDDSTEKAVQAAEKNLKEKTHAELNAKRPNQLLEALIGLCQVVAFADRTRSEYASVNPE